MEKKCKIAILASGNGTNAEAIIKHLASNPKAVIDCVIASKPQAGVIKRAENLGVEAFYLPKEVLISGSALLKELQARGIDLVVLAGYLFKLPDDVVEAYPERVINIHPALLPSYGGKGMYGDHVHEAVIKAGEKQSGITVHCVDTHYDHGKILLQARCDVHPGDTVDSLAGRIHHLEHRYFPQVVEQLVESMG